MTNSDWAIRTQGLSKKFGLTLRQSMKYGLRDAMRRLAGVTTDAGHLREGEFWALQDVTFELRPGEAMGIMGVNGCGKTTLLRLLNGVYSPDRGTASLRGRVGAMIAAGAGFAPMLSGRENVYVNGTLLGLSTREIDGLMDEIIAFSELGQFIDLPVKNYSSGMYVRLGFAIAALSRPDVLLMDEVLAVGDLNFQKKCFEHILKLKSGGTAIVLVSHSPGAIWSVCDRGLFMDRGQVKVDGAVEDVIKAYDDQNARNSAAANAQFEAAAAAHGHAEAAEGKPPAEYGHSQGGTGEVVCDSVKLIDPSKGAAATEFGFRAPFRIESILTLKEPQTDLLLRFTIDAMHYRFIATLDSYEQGMSLERVEAGRYRLQVDIPDQNFRPGAYTVNIGVTRKGVGVHLFYWFAAARFVILHPSDIFLYGDDSAVMHLSTDFELDRITVAESASVLA